VKNTIYKLTVDDVQFVALEAIDRKLTEKEINDLIQPIAKRIDWYNAIEAAILEKIK
jgi:hypothetical protein